MTEWLTSKEASAYAKVSADVLRDAAQTGALSAVKVCPGSTRSKWLFTHDDIDAWLEKGRTGIVPIPRSLRRTA